MQRQPAALGSVQPRRLLSTVWRRHPRPLRSGHDVQAPALATLARLQRLCYNAAIGEQGCLTTTNAMSAVT